MRHVVGNNMSYKSQETQQIGKQNQMFQDKPFGNLQERSEDPFL